jgi:hypothetical protein
MRVVLSKKKQIDVVEDALIHFLGGATQQELKEWLGWNQAERNAASEVIGMINHERLKKNDG